MIRRTALIVVLLLLVFRYAYAAQKITLDFVDVELATFAKFVSDTTGKNFIFDDRLKGKVTIITPSGLNKDQTFRLFTSVLELKGFTLEPAGVNAYKIIPVSEARQKALPFQTTHINDSYMIRLIPLKYIAPDDAVRFLSPVVSRDGYLAAFSQGSFLLVIDSGLNIEKIIRILGVIDTPPIAHESELVILKYASAEEVARIINEGLQKPSPGKVVPPKAIAETRLNAIVLLGDKGDKDAMKKLIALLDVPAKEIQGGINVYFLKYADATELAKTLQSTITGQQAAKTPALPGQPAAAGQPQKIIITPDKGTNSLVIMASQSDYQNLRTIIAELDRPKKQVFVQAMIVEASINGLRALGTQWRGVVKKGGEPVLIGGVGTIDSSEVLNIINGLSGLSVGGLGNFMNINITNPDGTTSTFNIPGYAALFNLSDFRDVVNVLSSPQVFTSDNQEAEIVVGENVPFITQRETAGAASVSTGLIASSIERKDVGIKLKITPHITEGDAVRLDIYQEISALEQPAVSGTDAVALLTQVGPTTTMRSTKTSVFVNNGQTIVIGGLMSETDENTVTKVPVLGDIPILGYLFKTKSVKKQKTNLLVFISPTIIGSPEDIQKVTEERSTMFGMKTGQYKPGELIVKFRQAVTAEEAQSVIKGQGASVLKKMTDNTYLLKIKEGQEVKDAASEFSKDPRVEFAEPDYTVRTIR
ncbi:MAG: type II secretion system secretin GspD [Nitrospiraceae bacterium]|nr:type II secretion system secretin GspD [Nitrospiraceae bacterium]